MIEIGTTLMPLFVYQGFSQDGSKARGTIDASSEAGVRELLQKRGIYPTSILPAHQAAASEGFFTRLFRKKVPHKDIIMFTKQLAVLLRSSVPLLQAIELLVEQFTGPLHSILVSVKDALKEGTSLADALKRYPDVFENIYIQLVRAGEASGKLEIILDRLVNYLESREELKAKISGALRGPLIQLVVIFAVSIFLMTSVVPTVVSPFLTQGKELPTPTQILIVISDVLTQHYLLLFFIMVIVFGSFLYWKSTKSGSYTFDEIKLKFPIIGFFSRMGAVVQFCSTLGMLLEGGVNLAESLDIVCNIIDNQVLKTALLEARDKIIKQGKIAQYLKQTNVFPPIAIYLISTGEESGKLDEMLLEVAKSYEKELSERADGLTSLIEPFMMIFMAVIVGFIVISIALPMMTMGEAFGV